MRNRYLLSNIIIGLLFAMLWVLIGGILYINYLYNVGMHFLIHFLWGVPFLAVLCSLIFTRKLGYKVFFLSFFVSSIVFTLIVSTL